MLCVFAVGVFAVAGGVVYWWPHSPIKITKDRQPVWNIDPKQPYQISFSRIGLPGCSVLEMTIAQDGCVVVERRFGKFTPEIDPHWETTTFTLRRDEVAKILEAIEATQVMKLHRDYNAVDTFDGCQESISIKQGEREKIVGCSNYFPEEFDQFVKQLETVISLESRRNVKWRPLARD
jgi:hypothetical protein